jgi:hypothetical protein
MPDWAYRYRATQREAADPTYSTEVPAGCKFPLCRGRVPPPQPASPSQTRQMGMSLQNRAVPRGFADMSGSPCAEFGYGGAIPAFRLRGPFLVSRF